MSETNHIKYCRPVFKRYLFKSNLHTATSKFTGSALGLVVVRSTGVTDDQFASGLFALS